MPDEKQSEKPVIKKRATFHGICQRMPPSEAGDVATYMGLNPQGGKKIMVDGEEHVAMDVPLVVQAPQFGSTDLSGPVRVTVLIERMPGLPKEEGNIIIPGNIKVR